MVPLSGASKGKLKGAKSSGDSPRKFKSENARREEATRLFDVAQAYRDRGDMREAANIFEEVAQIAHDNADAQYHAGMAHLQVGALDKAQKRWEECMQLDPEHSVAMFNLATLLAEKGNLVDATKMMERVVEKQPNDADNHKTLAILHFKQNMNEQAIAGYMRCIRAAPLHSDCYCGMGNSFVKIGRHEEALEAYTAAVNINPQEPGYLNNVGNLLVRHHRFNNTAQMLAIRYLTDAIKLDGEYADGYFNLGEAFSAIHRHDQAMAAIRQAIKLDPQRADYKCTLHLDMRKVCDWADFDTYTRDLETLWQEGTPAGMSVRSTSVLTRKPGEAKSRRREKDVTLCPSPLDALSYTLSLGVLRNIALGHGDEAEYFAQKSSNRGKEKATSLVTSAWPLAANRRIRVGYVSIELRDRPVGKDMLHALNAQKTDVDVLCFSLNPSPNSQKNSAETMHWHTQLVAACASGFHDISGVAFTDAAQRINEARPHILINLDGWTSAPLINEIISLQPAPVQLNFKGYPGTTGVRQHHTLVSDRIVTPPDLAFGYVEHLLLLPHSYHYNGHDQLYAHMYQHAPGSTGGHGYTRSKGWPTRADLVAARFMMPSAAGARPVEALDAEAAALPHASLWLLAWNEEGKKALRRHAAESARYLAQARQEHAAGGWEGGHALGQALDAQLTFTTFFEERWHTAAKGVCDLFVDTYPYSSHGTAAGASPPAYF